ncbi:MAG: D-2-hydroxyacid dehydrogenase [Deinococcota bacterium]
MKPITLLICSYFEPQHVEDICKRFPQIEVVNEPDLLPKPQFAADHAGLPLSRSEQDQARWEGLLEQADICFDFDRITPQVQRNAPNLRWIQATSSGIGQFAKQHGFAETDITLTNAAGIHARPLAEFVLWAMLAFTKDYPRARQQQRDHVWQRFSASELTGKTLAVVGLGRIGQEVARLAKLMDMKVIGSKRNITNVQADELYVDALYKAEDVLELAALADYLCLVVPHTDDTEHLVSTEVLAAMKPEAVLINIGRGALVDEGALVDALEQNQLAGAVLDVAAEEPLQKTSPLWDMDNVIIFPHSASTSVRENARLTELLCDNLERYLTGKPLRNVVDVTRLY